MKNYLSKFTLFVAILMLSLTLLAQKRNGKSTTLCFKNIRKQCVLIPAKIITSNRLVQEKKIISNEKIRIHTQAAFMLNHEVSVAEYLLFYQAMCDSIGTENARQLYYPDTLCMMNEFPYSYNEPEASMYFWHPKWNNYPVTGISWKQATAYCNWLSTYIGFQKNKYIIRLPYTAEWLAAIDDRRTKQDKDLRLWDYILKKEKESDLKAYNTGEIKDQGDVQIRGYGDDGYVYTAPCRQGEKNKYGIYHMLGNVAELMNDSVFVYHNVFDIESFSKQKEKTIRFNDSLNKFIDTNMLYDAFIYQKNEVQPQKFKQETKDYMPDFAIIKGASWADNFKYLNPEEYRLCTKSKQSSVLGFRFVMVQQNK